MGRPNYEFDIQMKMNEIGVFILFGRQYKPSCLFEMPVYGMKEGILNVLFCNCSVIMLNEDFKMVKR